MSFLGVDGCKAGWFWVHLMRSGECKADIARSFGEIWGKWSQAELILVDIPIGLRDEGADERLCDREARRVLGRPRSSSVFPAPCRPALCAGGYDEACRINKGLTGRHLSRQTWNILRKIQEVDALLQSCTAARKVIRETHPEVLFWALNGGKAAVHNKRTEDGSRERLRLLQRYFSSGKNILTSLQERFPRKDVGRDDILDALAAAVAGLLGGQSLSSLPEHPECDSTGLPMQILYYRCAPATGGEREMSLERQAKGEHDHGKARTDNISDP